MTVIVPCMPAAAVPGNRAEEGVRRRGSPKKIRELDLRRPRCSRASRRTACRVVEVERVRPGGDVGERDRVDAGLHREVRGRELRVAADAATMSNLPMDVTVGGKRGRRPRPSPASARARATPTMKIDEDEDRRHQRDRRLSATATRSTAGSHRRRIRIRIDRADDDRDVAVRRQEDPREVEHEDDEPERPRRSGARAARGSARRWAGARTGPFGVGRGFDRGRVGRRVGRRFLGEGVGGAVVGHGWLQSHQFTVKVSRHRRDGAGASSALYQRKKRIAIDHPQAEPDADLHDQPGDLHVGDRGDAPQARHVVVEGVQRMRRRTSGTTREPSGRPTAGTGTASARAAGGAGLRAAGSAAASTR